MSASLTQPKTQQPQPPSQNPTCQTTPPPPPPPPPTSTGVNCCYETLTPNISYVLDPAIKDLHTSIYEDCQNNQNKIDPALLTVALNLLKQALGILLGDLVIDEPIDEILTAIINLLGCLVSGTPSAPTSSPTPGLIPGILDTITNPDCGCNAPSNNCSFCNVTSAQLYLIETGVAKYSYCEITAADCISKALISACSVRYFSFTFRFIFCFYSM